MVDEVVDVGAHDGAARRGEDDPIAVLEGPGQSVVRAPKRWEGAGEQEIGRLCHDDRDQVAAGVVDPGRAEAAVPTVAAGYARNGVRRRADPDAVAPAMRVEEAGEKRRGALLLGR